MPIEKIGFTSGVFDMFHVGHLNILKKVADRCDQLIVSVTTDELAIEAKGRRPIIPYDERCEIVRAIRFVDLVIPQVDYDKVKAWESYHFHRIFVGDDWRNTERWIVLENRFRALGVEVVYLPYTQHTSSTKLREVLDYIYREPRDRNGNI